MLTYDKYIYVISLDYVLVWRMVEVNHAEPGHICCVTEYSPVFRQRGPPAARSGYVHLEGLHTGLSRDAVSARTKRKHTSQEVKMQSPGITILY